MSFSKAQIAGQHFLTRTGNYSTVPFRNGRVDVMPRHAKSFEIPCESIEDIRENLAESARAIDAAIALNPPNKAQLIENKKKINQSLSSANFLKKAERSSKVHLSSFLMAARVMLTEDVFDPLYQEAVENADIAMKDSRMLRVMQEKLQALKRSSQQLASFAVLPEESSRTQGATEFEKDKKEINRCANLIEQLKESYISESLEQLARERLTDYSLNILMSVSGAVKKPGEVKRIVKATGGKRQFKNLASSIYQD